MLKGEQFPIRLNFLYMIMPMFDFIIVYHVASEIIINWCFRSVYHIVTDAAILRFMVEACWGPMLAAFSMTLDQTDDKLATSLCLQGFRYAVHVTAVMGMQTQRDAFVTSMAKFTYLHNAADMKQKNVDAVKVGNCLAY